jgi:cell division protein ZapA (FtsZ GTPase activity inhibitor)
LKKRFEVKILGQGLSVVSDSGDEHVANVIRLVSDKVEEAGNVAGSKNTLNIAILAALNIADEYLRAVGVKEHTYNQLESRTEKMIRLINDIK